MCRLLGLVAATPVSSDSSLTDTPLPARRHLIGAPDVPNSLRVQARGGATPKGTDAGHADSWGVGYFDATGKAALRKGSGSAWDAPAFADAALAAEAGDAEAGSARTLIGHLRKASCGAITAANAHPFRAEAGARGVLLVEHNGTLYSPVLDPIREELAAAGRPEARADSDSQLVAGYLGNRVAHAPHNQTTFEALAQALRALFHLAAEQTRGEKLSRAYSAINLLIADSNGLYALRQFSKDPHYYTLLARPLLRSERADGGWIVASEATDAHENTGSADALDVRSQAKSALEWEMLMPGVLYFYPQGADRGSKPQILRVAEAMTPDLTRPERAQPELSRSELARPERTREASVA